MKFGDKTNWQHFRVGIQTAAVFTILCTLGAMSAAEFKDEQHGGKLDWTDWWFGMAGGVVGQILQLLIIWAIWKLH